MPKTTVNKIPCTICGYDAWSEKDLEGHTKSVHGRIVEPEKKTDGEAQAQSVSQVAQTQPTSQPAPSPRLPPGIFVPPPQTYFWIAERVANELYIIGKKSSRGDIINVKILGPAGVGKTTLGWEFAAAMKRPCFEINWGAFQEPGQVWGKDGVSMETGSYYNQARYVDAMETPNCVIICDEPNRCPPEVMNANFSLWDWRRSAWVDDLQRKVRVAPGVVFFGCMNEGSEYIGTNPLDKAIRERFGRTIRLTWPPMKVEAEILVRRTGVEKEIAEKLARFARAVRRDPKIGCVPSTRQLLVAAEDVVEGAKLPDAVMYAIINDLDEGVDKKALLLHLQIIGKIDDAWVNGKSEEDDDK